MNTFICPSCQRLQTQPLDPLPPPTPSMTSGIWHIKSANQPKIPNKTSQPYNLPNPSLKVRQRVHPTPTRPIAGASSDRNHSRRRGNEAARLAKVACLVEHEVSLFATFAIGAVACAETRFRFGRAERVFAAE